MTSDSVLWPTLTLILGAVAWFLGTGMRRGSMLSPFSQILLILISIFGFRPLLMSGEPESFIFYGYNIANGHALASLIGFVGLLGFTLGYSFQRVAVSKRAAVGTVEELQFEPPVMSPERAAVVAWSLLAIWMLAMMFVGGGPSFLILLFEGRSEAVNKVFAGVPAIVPALPVVGCLMAATVRFRWERAHLYTRSQNITYWVLAVVAVIPPSALGTRRFIIPSVLIMLLGALANTWNRKVRPGWLLGGAAAFLVLAVVPFVRSAGSRVGGETDLLGAMSVYFRDEGLRGTLSNFFLSYDTEMFNYIAFFAPRMGETIPYGMGRGTVGEIFAMPIPAAFSPFDRWNDVLLNYAFASHCSLETVCPVPSIIGVFYTDMSFPAVVAGMFILGITAANFERSILHSSGNLTALLLLVGGFSVLFARGNSMAQLWIAVQVFVLWWMACKVALALSFRRPAPQPTGTRTARVRGEANVKVPDAIA